MNRLTDLVLAHRRLVVAFWVLVAAAGIVTASTTVDRLSYDFSLPGAAAYETNAAIVDRLGNGGSIDPLVVVSRGPGAAPTARSAGAAIREAVPGTRVVEPGTSTTSDGSTAQDALATDDAAVTLVYPPLTPGPEPYAATRPRIDAVVERIAERAGPTDVELVGFTALSESGGGEDRGVLVEVVLGGTGALVVLALVFGSLLAGLPLLVAAVSILALFGLTAITEISFVVQFLIALIGLGVAIDYSLPRRHPLARGARHRPGR